MLEMMGIYNFMLKFLLNWSYVMSTKNILKMMGKELFICTLKKIVYLNLCLFFGLSLQHLRNTMFASRKGFGETANVQACRSLCNNYQNLMS